MISILQAQLFRLKKSKLFWILMAVCAGITILGALLMLGMKALLDATEMNQVLEAYGLTAVGMLSTFASTSSNSAILAIICSSVVLSREFSQGTVRNALLANKSRTQLFLAYWLTSLIVGGSYFVLEYLLTVVTYAPILGMGSSGAEAVTTALCYLALGLCSVVTTQTCVCLFLFCVRKTATAVIVPLVLCLVVPSLLSSLIEMFLATAMMRGAEISETLLKCLPFVNLKELNLSHPADLTMAMIIVYDLVFAAAFFVGGFFGFQKADLK